MTARVRLSAAARSATAPARARKNPNGGLTAAGRKYFAKKQGAKLKPGVKKPLREMTDSEMRRKGSWAVRLYGREDLPQLKDAKGKPTRYALSAAAWGEPVPTTVAQARRIAAKGHRLLERYRKRTEKKKAKPRRA